METRNEGSNPPSALNLVILQAELKLRFQSHHLLLAQTFTIVQLTHSHPNKFRSAQWGNDVIMEKRLCHLILVNLHKQLSHSILV